MVGIRARHLRVYVDAPGLELPQQALRVLRALLREVVRLPQVARQIEELDAAVLEPLDQLQVAVADRTAGTTAPNGAQKPRTGI